jgi:hypothetical protein
MRSRAAGLTCTVPDCDREVRCKGLCRVHYERFHLFGRLEKADTFSPDERFWSKVTIGQARPPRSCPSRGRAGTGLEPSTETDTGTSGTRIATCPHTACRSS